MREKERKRKRERQSEKERERKTRERPEIGAGMMSLPPTSPPQPCQKAGQDIVKPGHRRKERKEIKREREGGERDRVKRARREEK